MTVKKALTQAQKQLNDAGITGSSLDSQLLLAHTIRQSREWLLAHPEDLISTIEQKQFFTLTSKRAARTPLSQLTNRREFYGLEFEVTSAVLTPRAETEKIAELAIKYAPPQAKLLDIGTGSGVLAISVAKHRPDLEIWASDISAPALAVAQRNANHHGTLIRFLKSDLFGSPNLSNQNFHTVVTNLPYLPENSDLMPEVTKEPAVALFGGPDGLDIYRTFLKQLPAYLSAPGYLFTECDPWQQPDLIKEANAVGLGLIEEDYFVLGFKLNHSHR